MHKKTKDTELITDSGIIEKTDYVSVVVIISCSVITVGLIFLGIMALMHM